MAGELVLVRSALLAEYPTSFELPQLVMECGLSEDCSGSTATNVELMRALNFPGQHPPTLVFRAQGTKLHAWTCMSAIEKILVPGHPNCAHPAVQKYAHSAKTRT